MESRYVAVAEFTRDWSPSCLPYLPGHVGAHHRMLSTYLNAIGRAGLDLAEVIEPANPVPRDLVLRCRRAQPGASR